MLYDIILTREDDKYIARAKEWPEVTVIESNRDAAIAQLKSQLLDYLTRKIEVVQVELPLSMESPNPGHDRFGWFKDDPTFDDLQAEIAAYRQELDRDLGNLTE